MIAKDPNSDHRRGGWNRGRRELHWRRRVDVIDHLRCRQRAIQGVSQPLSRVGRDGHQQIIFIRADRQVVGCCVKPGSVSLASDLICDVHGTKLAQEKRHISGTDLSVDLLLAFCQTERADARREGGTAQRVRGALGQGEHLGVDRLTKQQQKGCPVPSPRGSLCPAGTSDNSPAFQRWVEPRGYLISPAGTAELPVYYFCRPCGT